MGGTDPNGHEYRAAFRELSDLTAQPAKSVLFFLNTAVAVTNYEGLSVLQHGQTTWYVGYQVGTGVLLDANWALRIRNVQKRLAVAAGIATSVETRML